jgi:5-methylcytosine-specific restriction endonuclease McrA
MTPRARCTLPSTRRQSGAPYGRKSSPPIPRALWAAGARPSMWITSSVAACALILASPSGICARSVGTVTGGARGASHRRGMGAGPWRRRVKKPTCERCGFVPMHPNQLHLDHIVPKALRGPDRAFNRQTLCANCHVLKSAQDVFTVNSPTIWPTTTSAPRFCARCGSRKVTRRGRRRNGKVRWRSICYKCHLPRQRLLKSTCKQCGFVPEHRCQLQLDHIIPIKRGGHSRRINFQTLCANCHALKSIKDSGFNGQPLKLTQPMQLTLLVLQVPRIPTPGSPLPGGHFSGSHPVRAVEA